MAYFTLCIRDQKNELVAAECAALTGRKPDPDGFALCESVSDVPRAAYLRLGASLLAVEATLDDLLGKIAGLNLDAEAFRIEVHCLTDGAGPPSRDVMVSVANALRGAYPNLSAPRHRFVVVIR